MIYKNNHTKVKIICPKHGIFNQDPSHHWDGVGCPDCDNSKKITKDDFIERANKIHGNKFTYLKVIYKNTYTNIKITCEEHGEFEQKPSVHLSGFGCSRCSGKNKLTTEEFIKEAKEVHENKYDYSLVKYKRALSKVEIICFIHGKFLQTPNIHKSGGGCPVCKESKGEKEIRIFLNKNNIKFESQKKFDGCKNKNHLPFDFYLSEYNICIEVNGRQHYESIDYFGGEKAFESLTKRDNLKIKYCEDNNIPLILFWKTNYYSKNNWNFTDVFNNADDFILKSNIDKGFVRKSIEMYYDLTSN